MQRFTNRTPNARCARDASCAGEKLVAHLLKGICAIAFGVLALTWPGVTIFTLVLLYGVYALLDGIFALTAAATGNTPAPDGGSPSSELSASAQVS